MLDVHLDPALADALLRRWPTLDVQSATEPGLAVLSDPLLLEILDEEGRVLVTRDVNTMPEHVSATWKPVKAAVRVSDGVSTVTRAHYGVPPRPRPGASPECASSKAGRNDDGLGPDPIGSTIEGKLCPPGRRTTRLSRHAFPG